MAHRVRTRPETLLQGINDKRRKGCRNLKFAVQSSNFSLNFSAREARRKAHAKA